MDSYMSRQRYIRRRTNSYRRPAANLKRGRLRRIIAVQTIICISLFSIIFAAKMINIPAGRFVTDNVRYILEHNVGLKSIYTYARSIASDIGKSIALGDKGSIQDDMTLSEEYSKMQVKKDGPKTGSNSGSAEADENTGAFPAAMAGAPDTVDASSGIDSTYDDAGSGSGRQGEKYEQTGVLAASLGLEESDDAYKAGYTVYDMMEPVEGRLVTMFGEVEAGAGMWKMHNGIDISVDGISDVRAVMDGMVTEAGSSPGYGRYIKVQHEDGLVTVYANCSSITADLNDIVKKGDVIAGVGGESVPGGSHLHFEVWHNDAPVDPLDYVNIAFR